LKARAHWVAADTILWDVVPRAGLSFFLVRPEDGPDGAARLPLVPAGGPDPALRQRFPHLAAYTSYRLSSTDRAKARDWLRGALAVTAVDAAGRTVERTSVQIPGVVDDVFAYDGPLGVTWEGGVPTLRLWAPTARSVSLHVFDGSSTPGSGVVPMRRDDATGVWSAPGERSWNRKFYLYEVEVYAPSTGRVERNLVTDPYSTSLSTNSRRSQIVDLGDPDLEPPGWRTLRKPPLEAPEDAVIYELHVRDFSIRDETVPEAHRGTFKAFTHTGSNGMKHLAALAAAGLTHVHLLPVFDFATVDEDRTRRVEPDVALLRSFPPDSDRQQEIAWPLRDKDGFNWGYDPLHYTTPEGSYATDPDGPARVVELREMVQSLAAAGLRVVLDVVYNHTHASGQDPFSVLDRIVPGYYHRLDADGKVETSTCCANTASEHFMMEKLIVDSVLTWARAYKVDGFRFDVMGHHMVSNMVRVQRALAALRPETDGVDGASLYLYGEGWDFGEVKGGARGPNASQRGLAGTGIGTFNDRLRDAVRGGSPRGLQEQGFATGLVDDPNGTPQGSDEERRRSLLLHADQIRVGLAGNLRDVRLVDREGKEVSGAEVPYRDQPAGYALDPRENVVYASAHDNETLFDAVQLKAPRATTMADRVRMNNLAVSLVALSQGVPFFHAGDDMLRSKSLDRNSYNSGDWWNALDFTHASSNWGVGLPPGENEKNWPVLKPLLADPLLAPRRGDIEAAASHFREMLRIRRSSRLFRLRTAAEVRRHLSFLDTGPDQVAGLVALVLDNRGPERLADDYDRIVVLFNARKGEAGLVAEALRGAPLALHEIQAASADPVVRLSRFVPSSGRFTVPGRTTAVFVERNGSRR
jgi:pullulanase-type alpha-1,6-glucosidase